MCPQQSGRKTIRRIRAEDCPDAVGRLAFWPVYSAGLKLPMRTLPPSAVFAGAIRTVGKAGLKLPIRTLPLSAGLSMVPLQYFGSTQMGRFGFIPAPRKRTSGAPESTMVNGVPVIEEGKMTNALPGRVVSR